MEQRGQMVARWWPVARKIVSVAQKLRESLGIRSTWPVALSGGTLNFSLVSHLIVNQKHNSRNSILEYQPYIKLSRLYCSIEQKYGAREIDLTTRSYSSAAVSVLQYNSTKLQCFVRLHVLRNSMSYIHCTHVIRALYQSQYDGIGRFYKLLILLWVLRLENDTDYYYRCHGTISFYFFSESSQKNICKHTHRARATSQRTFQTVRSIT